MNLINHWAKLCESEDDVQKINETGLDGEFKASDIAEYVEKMKKTAGWRLNDGIYANDSKFISNNYSVGDDSIDFTSGSNTMDENALKIEEFIQVLKDNPDKFCSLDGKRMTAFDTDIEDSDGSYLICTATSDNLSENDNLDWDSEKNGDDLTIQADAWEQLQKDIAKANSEYEAKRGLKKEAEEDEEDDVTDPDTENAKAAVDRTVSDLEDVMKHNDNLADNPEYQDTADKIKKMRSNKDTDSEEYKDAIRKLSGIAKPSSSDAEKEANKKWYVYECVKVYKPVTQKKDFEKAKSSKEMLRGESSAEEEINVVETREFYTEKEAGAFVKGALEACSKTLGISPEDFKLIKDKQEVETTDASGKRVKIYLNGLPHEIQSVDPNAFGYLYTNVEGRDKEYGMGPKKDKSGADTGVFQTIDRITFAEFIVYRSNAVAPFSDAWGKLFKEWLNANSEVNSKDSEEDKQFSEFVASIREELKNERQKYEDGLKGLSKLQQEIAEVRKQTTINAINHAIGYDLDDEAIVKGLKPFFQNMSDDDLLNISDEELQEFTLQKLIKIKQSLLGKSEEDDDYGDDEDGEVELAMDEEILKAAARDGFATVSPTGGPSVDGYDTRGDATKADKEDAADVKKKEEEEEEETSKEKTNSKRDSDMDDYEGSQGETSGSNSTLKNHKEYKKDDAKTTMHGVKVSKKFLDYLNAKIDKKDWPKNAEEVKSLKKKVEEEW